MDRVDDASRHPAAGGAAALPVHASGPRDVALEEPPGSRPPEPSTRTDIGLTQYAVLVAAGAFATTFAQSKILGYYPTTFLLKTHMHLGRQAVANFWLWATFAWNLKPLAGILTDAFPLLGTRRRSYMLAGSFGAGLMWLAMALFPHQYSMLLLAAIGMNILIVVASTVMGGLMVEAGHAFGAPGRIASLRQYVQSIAGIAAPALGGWLASKVWGWNATTCVAAATVFALGILTLFVLRERRVVGPIVRAVASVEWVRQPIPAAAWIGLAVAAVPTAYLVRTKETQNIGFGVAALLAVFLLLLILLRVPTSNAVLVKAQSQLSQILRSRPLWMAVIMMALVYTVPGLGVALTYRQTDVLKFPTWLPGALDSLGSIFAVAGAAIYVLFCRKIVLRTLLPAVLVANGLATLLYLVYSRQTAPLISALGGFLGSFNELAIMDLAVRSTPVGCEALGFALIMSVRNFGIGMTDVIGTKMMDQWHWGWNQMVVINASTTLLALVFTPLLPRAVMNRLDKAGGADIITSVLLVSVAGLFAGGVIGACIVGVVHPAQAFVAYLTDPITLISALVGLVIAAVIWNLRGNSARKGVA